MLLYLDTNVVMDFALRRTAVVDAVFLFALNCKADIVISDLTVEEAKRHHVDCSAACALVSAAGKLRFVVHTREDKARARIRAMGVATHLADALHAELAAVHGAVLVTSNVRDFPFDDILVRRPEDYVNK